MSEERKRGVAPWIAGVVLLALIGGYVGSYYEIVQPVENPFQPLDRQRDGMEPVYEFAGIDPNKLSRFWKPIHTLDRHIRAHVWDVTHPAWKPPTR